MTLRVNLESPSYSLATQMTHHQHRPALGRQHLQPTPAWHTVSNIEHYPPPLLLFLLLLLLLLFFLLLPVFTSPHPLLPCIKNTAMSEFSSCLCPLRIYGIRDPWSLATEAPSTASLVTPGHILKMVQPGFCKARQY